MIVAAALIEFVFVAVATPTATLTATPDGAPLTDTATAATVALKVGVGAERQAGVAPTVTDSPAVTDEPLIVATTTSLRVFTASAPAPLRATAKPLPEMPIDTTRRRERRRPARSTRP